MKIAKLSNGQTVMAAEEAPPQARCTYCGGIVILRKRQLMNRQDIVYYWRHQDNKNQRCPARSRRFS